MIEVIVIEEIEAIGGETTAEEETEEEEDLLEGLTLDRFQRVAPRRSERIERFQGLTQEEEEQAPAEVKTEEIDQ